MLLHLKAICLFLLLSPLVCLAQKKTDTLFYPNGKIIQKITISDKNAKTILQFNYQGKLSSKEEFLNDKREGLSLRYNNGILLEETLYKEGLKNGTSKVYSQTGLPQSVISYKNDTIHGLSMKYYDIGTLQSKEYYADGSKYGESQTFFRSGKISTRFFYDTVWIPNVTKNAKIKYRINYVPTGTCKTWYESGFKKSEEHYLKGKRNGVFKEWYENGKPKSESHFVKDLGAGRQIKYHQNGNLSEDFTTDIIFDSVKKYHQVFYEGNYLKFDESKNPLVKGFYKHRQRQGKWQEFNNGKLFLDADYKNGYLVNTFKTYHANTTQLSHVLHYKETTLHGKDTSYIDGESISYFINGVISDKSLYVKGLSVNANSFYENGIIGSKLSIKDSIVYKVDHYRNGNPEREYIAKYNPLKDVTAQKFEISARYYENGALKQTYYNDLNPVKITKEFNDSGKVIFRKYYLTDEMGIETDYYNSGALKSESVTFQNYYKTPGMQYVEWFENGRPKRFETYGLYQINWLSNGVLYNTITYTNYNPNLVHDTVMDPLQVSGIYQALLKSKTKSIALEGITGKTLSTYDDQHVKIETVVENGSIDKYLKLYYISGKLFAEYSIKAGVQDGPFAHYFENGRVRQSGNYCNGKLCGIWLECDLKGDTMSYYEYEKPANRKDYAKFYTFYKEYFHEMYKGMPTKKLKSFHHFKNGKLDGELLEYHVNGNLSKQAMMKEGKEIGTVKTYWLTGNLSDEYTLDANGKRQGPGKKMFENGKPQGEMNFENGKLHGPYNFYWPNGKLRTKGTYSYDQKVGEWFNYDSTGVSTKGESYDAEGKKIMSELNTCNCKTEDVKIGFAPLLSGLMDVERADVWQFGFHTPITKYLKNVFYVGMQTSSSSDGKSRFTSLSLIAFTEIITRLPDSKGLQFVLNPCNKFQPYSRIPLNLHATQKQPNETRMELTPEMVSFRFNTKLLTPKDKRFKETEAYFKTTYIQYTKKGIELQKPASQCFTPSWLTGTDAVISLDTFVPCIQKEFWSLEFYKSDFSQKNNVFGKDPFTGIYEGKGMLSSMRDPQFAVPVSNVLISENIVAGEIILKPLAQQENGIKYTLGSTKVSEEKAVEAIKALFKNAVVNASRNDSAELVISFLIKAKI